MIWNLIWKIWNLKFNPGELEKEALWRELDLQDIEIHCKGGINKIAGWALQKEIDKCTEQKTKK